MSNLFEDGVEGEKLGVSTSPVSLEKVRFGCGPGMQKLWACNSAKFLDCVSGRFGHSVRASLEAGKIVVTEIDKKILPKFDAEEEMKVHVEGLKHWQQEECEIAKENHDKICKFIYRTWHVVFLVRS